MPEVDKDLKIMPFENDTIILQGEIHRDNVFSMVEQLIENPIPYCCDLTIDVSDLDIESGVTLLTLVNTFKALSRRVTSLTICGASKPLYNSMFSTGLLSGSNPIIMIQTKAEEPQPV
jgi:hypothetical protein